jgi:pimeloyl-ACP methyl ester carboxylesterase
VPERLAQEDHLSEQEQRRAPEGEDCEAKGRVVAGMDYAELVTDGDRDQPEHDQGQRPRAPPPDGPGWYLITTDDRMIPPQAQREMSGRTGATVEEAAASHSVYVSQPGAVAEIVKKAAAAT